MNDEYKAKIAYNGATDEKDLYFVIRRWNNGRTYLKCTWEHIENYHIGPIAPALDSVAVAPSGDIFNSQVLQAIFEACWADGMRPKGYIENTAEVNSMKAHLNDLRTIAFKGLKIP